MSLNFVWCMGLIEILSSLPLKIPPSLSSGMVHRADDRLSAFMHIDVGMGMLDDDLLFALAAELGQRFHLK